jgi:hypothetical protein
MVGSPAELLPKKYPSNTTKPKLIAIATENGDLNLSFTIDP